MGNDNVLIDRLWPVPLFDPDGSMAIARAEESGRLRAERLIEARRIAGDAEATRYLAEMNCPEDIKAFGQNHNIPTFAEMTWMAGFISGWRMARSGNPNDGR